MARTGGSRKEQLQKDKYKRKQTQNYDMVADKKSCRDFINKVAIKRRIQTLKTEQTNKKPQIAAGASST
jgi:hypothetical protein